MITQPTKELNINPDINPAAKVWIYQASRQFTPGEMDVLTQKLDAFVANWHAHGTSLKSYYQIFYNRFICLFVDESGYGASGCSIDSSVHFIKALEKEFDVDLMNRMETAYLNARGEVETIRVSEIKSAVGSGHLDGSTPVFNNLVATKGEMQRNWLVPMRESWQQRFLN